MSLPINLIHLPHRTLISITGDDRWTFLQGLLTQDICALKDNPTQTSTYAALLSSNGRFLYDLFLIKPTNEENELWVDCETSLKESLIKHLTLYKLRSKVNLQPLDFSVYASLSKEQPQINNALCTYQDPRLEEMGWRAIMESSYEGTQPLSVYHNHRIDLAVPEGTFELTQNKSIVLENNFDELHAMNWTKGCYVGQELMARTRYIGKIRKRLLPISFKEAPHTLEIGSDITITTQNGSEKLGEIRFVHENKGLALIRLENLPTYENESFSTCTVQTDNGLEITVHKPFWLP